MKIKRIWGIPIHKVFSDEEIIEGVRKNLKRSNKYVWIHIGVLILLALTCPMLGDAAMDTIKQMPDEHKKMGWLGLMTGFSIGIFIGQYFMIAAHSIFRALFSSDFLKMNRTNKLLVKYHDMLKEKGLLEGEEEEQNDKIFREGEDDRQPLCR